MRDFDILQTRLIDHACDYIAIAMHPAADDRTRHVAMAGLWGAVGMLYRTIQMQAGEKGNDYR